MSEVVVPEVVEPDKVDDNIIPPAADLTPATDSTPADLTPATKICAKILTFSVVSWYIRLCQKV